MTIYDHVERLVNHFQIPYDEILEQGATPMVLDMGTKDVMGYPKSEMIYVIAVSEDQFWKLRESIAAIRDYVEGR
jgi:2-hydroxy-3-keto-5-methylthiopentenyl-1-phosphate phosphatase